MKNIKTILSSIWTFMCDIGHASYSAHLARNGKYAQAQAHYKK